MKIAKIILLLSLLAATVTCKKEASDPANDSVIRIGEVGSLTGSEATFGTSTNQGAKLALKHANAQGGVKGKTLELVTLDDQSKAEEAATTITKLITQDRVLAVIGEVASSRSLAMAPIAQTYKVPMVSPSSTNPKVTEQGDYIFRVCFIDPFQGKVMAKFALNNLNARRVAILRDLKSDYSMGLADYFIPEFKNGGGEITLDQSYSGGDTDFKAQLTSIKSTNPDAIFIPGYYGDSALIARQARELGITATFLGGDGWDSPKLSEIGGKAIEGGFFSTHFSAQDTAPLVQDFVKAFQAEYGVAPDGLAASGYDAAIVVIDALKRAPTLATKDIRDALAATKDFPGVTGSITIDNARNAIKPAVILKVVNGQYVYETTVKP